MPLHSHRLPAWPWTLLKQVAGPSAASTAAILPRSLSSAVASFLSRHGPVGALGSNWDSNLFPGDAMGSPATPADRGTVLLDFTAPNSKRKRISPMKLPQYNRRTRRAANPYLEHLDDRIVPSTMHVAIAAGAEAEAAVSVTQRHADHLDRLEMRHDRAVARHELRLARHEARFLANHPGAITPISSPSVPGALPANVGVQFQSLYSQYETYERSGGSGTFSPTGVSTLEITGTYVGVQVKDTITGDFNSLIAELQGDGMQISDSSSTYGIVEGMLPIAQLPTAAQLPQTLSITPILNPILE
jgi:hypothetical protein